MLDPKDFNFFLMFRKRNTENWDDFLFSL
jgi:hypothetical protein